MPNKPEINKEPEIVQEKPAEIVKETSKQQKKTLNWRSQTAFELSSSISCESEASFIINEFLHKTTTSNAVNNGSTTSNALHSEVRKEDSPTDQRKMESYV